MFCNTFNSFSLNIPCFPTSSNNIFKFIAKKYEAPKKYDYSSFNNYTPKYEPISSDDAVHLATALQRGDDVKFLTSDHKLIVLNIDHITFLS